MSFCGSRGQSDTGMSDGDYLGPVSAERECEGGTVGTQWKTDTLLVVHHDINKKSNILWYHVNHLNHVTMVSG